MSEKRIGKEEKAKTLHAHISQLPEEEQKLVYKIAGQLAPVCADEAMNFGLLKDPAKIFSDIKRSFESEIYETVFDTLTDRKEALELRFKDRYESAYSKAFIANAVGSFQKAVHGLGDATKVEVYSLVLKNLNVIVRENYPMSDLFLDLMIKDILLGEPDSKIRKAAWEGADLKNKDSLRYADLFMLDRARK